MTLHRRLAYNRSQLSTDEVWLDLFLAPSSSSQPPPLAVLVVDILSGPPHNLGPPPPLPAGHLPHLLPPGPGHLLAPLLLPPGPGLLLTPCHQVQDGVDVPLVLGPILAVGQLDLYSAVQCSAVQECTMQ